MFPGRISISCRVGGGGVREEAVPTTVAPKGFQTHQGFIPLLTPKLPRAFEAALRLPTGRFNRAAADGFAAAAAGAVVHARLMFVKIIDLAGHRCDGSLVRQSGQRRFELPDDFESRLVLQLADQGFEPRLALRLVFAKERAAHRRQVLHGVIEVQSLLGLGKAIVGQPPDPHGPVGNDQRAGGLTEPAPQALGVELFAQGVNALAGGDEAAFGDDGPSAGRLAAMIQPEAGAGINPVPAFGFAALWPQSSRSRMFQASS